MSKPGRFALDPDVDDVGNLYDSLQEGEGICFESAEPPLELGMAKRVSSSRINELNKLKDVYHIITNSMRERGPEYIYDLERTVFPPGTSLNRQLTFHMIKWCEVAWSVATIPARRLRVAERIARKYNFVLQRTVPVMAKGGLVIIQMSLMIDRRSIAPPELLWFPIDTNTLTVEQVSK